MVLFLLNLYVEDHLHPGRDGTAMLITSVALLSYAVFARRTTRPPHFELRIRHGTWGDVTSRIVCFLLGTCFLFGALDQLMQVN